MAHVPDDGRHPIARLGRTLSEIAAASGVQRSNLSLVVNRHRHRLGQDANRRIQHAFPDYDLDAALWWSWPCLRRPTSRRSRK